MLLLGVRGSQRARPREDTGTPRSRRPVEEEATTAGISATVTQGQSGTGATTASAATSTTTKTAAEAAPETTQTGGGTREMDHERLHERLHETRREMDVIGGTEDRNSYEKKKKELKFFLMFFNELWGEKKRSLLQSVFLTLDLDS